MTPPASPPQFDKRELRNALGTFPTGVTVVTTRAPSGAFVGLTVNSFSSLSLDPPLVLWSLNDFSSSLVAFEQASHFAINILADDQSEISKRFASQRPDKFAGLEVSEGAGGCPLIDGSAAQFVCRRTGQQREGDHVLFIGRVEAMAYSAKAPLVYFRGQYFSTAAATPVPVNGGTP
jgi:flavin reductase (DIM6/NTAB) family NADH-FMN oxidoreductase RutF